MAEVEVEVEVDDTKDAAAQEDSVAESHLIDGAIDAGKSAGEADLHQHQAERHASAAAGAAALASDAAAMAQDGADRTEDILSRLGEITEQNARILAATASMHSQEHASTALDDVIETETNDNIEIEPENEHFLTRKWNLGFGKKK